MTILSSTKRTTYCLHKLTSSRKSRSSTTRSNYCHQLRAKLKHHLANNGNAGRTPISLCASLTKGTNNNNNNNNSSNSNSNSNRNSNNSARAINGRNAPPSCITNKWWLPDNLARDSASVEIYVLDGLKVMSSKTKKMNINHAILAADRDKERVANNSIHRGRSSSPQTRQHATTRDRQSAPRRVDSDYCEDGDTATCAIHTTAIADTATTSPVVGHRCQCVMSPMCCDIDGSGEAKLEERASAYVLDNDCVHTNEQTAATISSRANQTMTASDCKQEDTSYNYNCQPHHHPLQLATREPNYTTNNHQDRNDCVNHRCLQQQTHKGCQQRCRCYDNYTMMPHYNHNGSSSRLCRSGPPEYPVTDIPELLPASQTFENRSIRRFYSTKSVATHPVDVKTKPDDSGNGEHRHQQDDVKRQQAFTVDTSSPTDNSAGDSRHYQEKETGKGKASLIKILKDYANKHPLDKEDAQGYFCCVRQPQLLKTTTPTNETSNTTTITHTGERHDQSSDQVRLQTKTNNNDREALINETSSHKVAQEEHGGYRSLYEKGVENLQRVFMSNSKAAHNDSPAAARQPHQSRERNVTKLQSHSHARHHHSNYEKSSQGYHSSRDLYHLRQDVKLKEENTKQVMPDKKQSPISLMSQNPIYRYCSRPLNLDYPATVDNVKLSNTGFTWEVKLPYQQSLMTALSGGPLPRLNRYHLDQFHCHWGLNNQEGSEHSVDGNLYTAELHFVHYNMDKYHSMSKAARQPDGLAVVAVFLEASDDHLNHAELDKVTTNLRLIPNKGDSVSLKQTIRLENLLPLSNRSFWSYQGSLTTPPYYESVTWFVLKQPIKCSAGQIEKFRQIQGWPCCSSQTSSFMGANRTPNGGDSSQDSQELVHQTSSSNSSSAGNFSPEDSIISNDNGYIQSNHRPTQPLHGRVVYNHDETYATARGVHRLF